MPRAEQPVPGPAPAGGPRRCAVLGHPISHSLSPALHRAAYAELGLDWRYDAVDVVEDELPGFLATLDTSWRGLSLTMPLKRAVLPLLASADPVALLVDAVNTVVRDEDGLHGWNTDVGGLVAALSEVGVGPGAGVERVLVLGGGATAASTIAALAELGAVQVLLAVREPARAAGVLRLADRCGLRTEVVALAGLDAVRGVPLVVSTLPGGAVGSGLAAVAARAVGPAGVVFDVVYGGWPTPLARAARAAGATVVSGADLLVHQARAQVLVFTGHDVALTVLRDALPPELRTAGIGPAGAAPMPAAIRSGPAAATGEPPPPAERQNCL